jgi:hypothetical protein
VRILFSPIINSDYTTNGNPAVVFKDSRSFEAGGHKTWQGEGFMVIRSKNKALDVTESQFKINSDPYIALHRFLLVFIGLNHFSRSESHQFTDSETVDLLVDASTILIRASCGMAVYQVISS